MPGEQPSKDLGHDDLLELFGHDKEWGLSEILLEQGTKIEIPMEDDQGVTFWIAGEISSYQTGSLNFKAEFPGCGMDVGIWSQTRNRADMDITWRLPPEYWKRQSAVHMILNTQGYTPWHHPHHGSHWLRLQTRGAWTYGDHELKTTSRAGYTDGGKHCDGIRRLHISRLRPRESNPVRLTLS